VVAVVLEPTLVLLAVQVEVEMVLLETVKVVAMEQLTLALVVVE
jgi:hypothetical protein